MSRSRISLALALTALLTVPLAVTAAEAVRLVEAGGGTSVIDVRTGAEFDGEHILGSRLIPFDQIAQRAFDIRATPAPRLLLCRTDSRAAMARQTLERLHIGGLSVVTGGIEAYASAGGATEKAEGAVALERQVRIAAGLLIVVGVALGFSVHVAFHGLAAFVGAGLVLAGATDWCGMGLLMARAPWNRSKDASGAGGPAAACAARPPVGGCSAAAQ